VKKTKCPECKSPRIVHDYELAERICTDCGYVLSERIVDVGPEWRFYDWERRTRAGPPITYDLHDRGLSTVIDNPWKDQNPARRADIYRLRKLQRAYRLSDPSERKLAFALSEIRRMTSQLGLPPRKVRESAGLLFHKVVEKRLLRGRSIESSAAAVLYIACRDCGIPRTLDEIAEVSRVKKKEISKSYRAITHALAIHPRRITPEDYVARFGSELGLSGETQSKAVELLSEIKRRKLDIGLVPSGIAAAAIYLAASLQGERRSQGAVAKAARVTEVTVRTRAKQISKELGLS